MTDGTKRCSKCGEEKPIADFADRPAALDGKRGQCKACQRTWRRGWRAARYAEDPDFRRSEVESTRAWRARQLAADPEGFRGRGAAYQRERMAEPENRERKRAQDRAYGSTNRERLRAVHRAYWARPENRERKKAHSRKYVAKPEIQERQRAYMAKPENRERRKAYIRVWAAARRTLLAGQFVEDVDPETLLERDQGYCGICGLLVEPADFHIDHMIPVSRGGEHSYANTQVAHPRCNLSKNARLPEELAA